MQGRKTQLRKKTTEISDLKAKNKGQKVVLVEKKWYDDLQNWLSNKGGRPPAALSTKSLLSVNKVKPNIKRGVDYEIVDCSIWPELIRGFGTTTKIEAILIKNPKNGEESILFKYLIFNIYLPKQRPSVMHSNSYSMSPAYMQYHSDPNWIVEDVKKQICEINNLDPACFSFSSHNTTSSSDRISDSLTMRDVNRRYSLEIDLKPKPISKKLTSENDTIKKAGNNITQTFSSVRNRNPSVPRFKRNLSDKSTFDTKEETSSRIASARNSSSTNSNQSPRNSSQNNDINTTLPAKNSQSIYTNSYTSTYTSSSRDLSTNNKDIQQTVDIDSSTISTRSIQSNQIPSRLKDNAKLDQSFFHDKPSFISYSGSKLPKPVGLNNLGNTCFFNAAVQCLSRCMPLTSFILSSDFDRQLNPLNPKSSKGKIAHAYRDFLEDLCKGSGYARDPSNLRRAVVSQFRRFANFGQHDSQELLCSLLDGLHEDMNQSSLAKGNDAKIPTDSNSDSWDFHVSRNSSPIVDIFHGILFSSISCPECKRVQKVRDPFMFLSLDIPRYRFNVKLADCLNAFKQKETLDANNKWKCDGCKQMVMATKEMGVERFPKKILIIHLKRFSGEGYFASKIDTSVDYPSFIEASEFAKEDKGRFKLIGAVFHSGGLGGGHYTAAAIDPASDTWYNFNDSIATKISEKEAHKAAAYILFYQRIE